VPGFGSAGGLGRVAVLTAIDDAVADGELVSSGGARPVLRPPAGGEAEMPIDEDVAERLRGWRRERARADGVPAYVVLTNASLDEVCRRMPGDADELLEVPGLGPARIERYGRDLLELLRASQVAGASRPPIPV
jgi:superfamily II DNA helicase RecQ